MTGPARVVLDPVGAHLEPGEILVAPSTDPGWTPLFLTAGGLVMEMGGSNSHGAVVAREYGIPAVVGVPEATSRIETGQLITVDGASGLVTVLTARRGMRRPARRSSPDGHFVESGEEPLRHFVDQAQAVDLDQHPARPVHLEQRSGLLRVHLHADPDGVLVVVGSAPDVGPLEQSLDDLLDVGQQDTTASMDVPESASMPSSVSTCATVRGYPSSRNPLAQSGWASRSATIALVMSSLT